MLLELVLINTFAALLSMILVYVISVRLNFYSIVDIAWAYAFVIVVCVSAFVGSGGAAQWLLSCMVTLWGVRLGTHLLIRIRSHFPVEDGRYTQLRTLWNADMRWKFFIFFLLQGLSVAILSLPLFLVAQGPASQPSTIQVIAAGIFLFAWVGEFISDAQLKRFKMATESHGRVCDVGLWKYSRHPNYFFEWLIWCCFALFSIKMPLGFLGLIAPASIFYLLFRVTGIPATEAQALRSKGSAYREYQSTTSMFVPWFRKKRV